VMGYYVFRSANFKRYLVNFKLFDIQIQRCKHIMKIGAPVAMQYVFEMGAFAAAAIMAGTFGPDIQAAHQIAITLAAMTYMMASGIASAATIMIGNNFGKNRFDRLKRYANTNYIMVLAFMCLTALIFATFNHLLPWIFTKDMVVIGIAAQLLVI